MDFLKECAKRDDLHHHVAWIRSFNEMIQSEPEIGAAVLLGSFAKGTPDRLSDIDLVVFAERPNLKTVSETLFQHRCFEVLHRWETVFSEDHVFGKYIYGNFVSAEIHVLSHASPFKIRKPYICLKETGDLISSRIEEGIPPRHEDFHALSAGIDGLGWELFDMLKWWQRGDRELVQRHLNKIMKQLPPLTGPTI